MSNEYRQPDSVDSVDSGGDEAARNQVAGPATGLMITAGVGIGFQLVGLMMNTLGSGFGAATGKTSEDQITAMFSGAAGVLGAVVGIAMGAVIMYGAMKMKRLESYGLALAVAIVAMIPCVSPCCLLGLPIGIWALSVLNKHEVKSAFH